jgi:hypothetical protein
MNEINGTYLIKETIKESEMKESDFEIVKPSKRIKDAFILKKKSKVDWRFFALKKDGKYEIIIALNTNYKNRR